jgi:exodeoxyribonuclease V alpha subunit
VKIFKTYGQAAIATVRENPYRLARDIRGIGFKTADKIARELGVPADSPLRATAGILHTLQELTDEGHVYVPEAELLRATEETLEIPATLLPEALARLVSDETVVVEPISASRAVYLTALVRTAPFVGKALALAQNGTQGLGPPPGPLPRGAGRRPSSGSPPDCAVLVGMWTLLWTAQ